MRNKQFIGDALGRAGRHLVQKRQFHSPFPEGTIFLEKEDFVPVGKSGLTPEITSKSMGKMQGGVFQHVPSGMFFMVKSPGVLNPTFAKNTKNVTTRAKEGRPVRNFVSRMEYAHGRVMQEALKPFNQDFLVAPVFMVASKTTDQKVSEKEQREHGYQKIYAASALLPIDEFATKKTSRAYAARMEDNIMKDSGDTFMKTFFPSVLIAGTDHPGPEFANIGITKPDGRIGIYDYDVGTLNSPFKKLFMDKNVSFQRLADEMRNIKDCKVDTNDPHFKAVQANVDAGRRMFYSEEGKQPIPTNKISQQLFLRRFAVGDARIGIHLTDQTLANIFQEMSTPSSIKHVAPEKQRAKEQADYKAINQSQGIGSLVRGRLVENHRLAAITHLMFPDVEDTLMPSAVRTVERYEDLKKEINGGRREIEKMDMSLKRDILQELVIDSGMEYLDLEFKEMRKKQEMDKKHGKDTDKLKSSSLSRL